MLSTVKLLEIEESYRNKVYYCSEGYPTWLIGKKVGRQGQPLSDFAMLDAPISVAYAWLDYDLQAIIKQCQTFKWFSHLNQARKDFVISMCYQMGFDGFCKFKNTIKLIDGGRFVEASKEMLDSAWAKQTPERAKRHSQVIATGEYNSAERYRGIA
jgi:lysozyme